MNRQRAYRALCVVAVTAAFLAIAAAFGRRLANVGVPGFVLLSRHLLLILAAASGLLAWAVSLARTPGELRASPPRRTGRFVRRLALMVITLNLLLLAQPEPPPDLMTCQYVMPIGGGFRHFLNCDSPEYLELAKEPSRVLVQSILQGRPLSFGLPFLVSQPLRLVPRLEKAGPYRYGPQFVAYLLINLGALLLAFLCFTWALEEATGARAGIELLVALVALGANDVTKLFFWTPHTQIFGLLVPCVSVYLSFRILARGKPLAPWPAALLGLGLGLGLLLYGLFIVPALAVAAIHVLMYRRSGPAALVLVGAVLPYACWVAVVYALIGSFYNHEAQMYRHFVWMIDCARGSIGSCGPVLRTHLLTFFNTAAPVVLVPALLAFGCRVARDCWPGEMPSPPPAPALGQAIALTLAANCAFLALMGAYAPRLCWQLVPPLLLVAALELGALRRSRPHARALGMNVGLALACVAYVVMLASRQGPYN